MYEYLFGKLVALHPSYLVLDVNGVGYHILMANPFRLTDQLNKEIQLYV